MSKSQSFAVNKKVSQLLIAERKAKGITQADLADRLGKPQSYVSKYENSERQLTVADFMSICKALKLKPEAIFKKAEN